MGARVLFMMPCHRGGPSDCLFDQRFPFSKRSGRFRPHSWPHEGRAAFTLQSYAPSGHGPFTSYTPPGPWAPLNLLHHGGPCHLECYGPLGPDPF